MANSRKTKAELIAENEALRSRIGELERPARPVTAGDFHPASDGTPNGQSGKRDFLIAENEREDSSQITSLTPVQFAYVDNDLRIKFLSNNSRQWFGGQRDGSEGKHIREVLGAATYRKILPRLKAVLAGTEQYFSFEAPGPNGDTRYVQAHYVPHIGEDSSVMGFHATILDNTESNRTEAALRESEERLSLILDISKDAIVSVNEDQRIILFNRRAEKTFGYAAEEVLGQPLDLLLPAESWENHRRHIRNFSGSRQDMVEKSERAEISGRRKDGGLFPAEVSISRVELNGGTIFTAILRDTSKRKQARMEFDRMAAALEQAGDCIFITDTDGAILYVNSAFERITGYTREEAIGQNPRILKSGKKNEEFYRELWKTLLRGEVWQGRLTNRRKDGTFYEVDGTNAPLRNEQGEIINFIAVQKDVSQQTLLEEQLRQSQKMEALGTLAGGIAHDFNNILTPILGYAEILQQYAEPNSKEMNYLGVINKSAFRAKELVSQILLFSRQAKSEKKISDLSPIVGDVINFMRSTLPKWITVRVEISEDLTPVLCNSSQLHQVLVNLCVNAGQAMPDSGELRITLKIVNLDGFKGIIGKPLSGKHVRIAVTDTGTGMNSGTLTHIFDPFFTTKEVGEGTGLGLSTVFGIVQEHSGGIRVTSQPGKGSTFEIFLPAVEQPVELTPASEITVSTGDETIFYIDDEEPIATLGKIILEGYGYKVTIGLDSLKALKRFEENPNKFDLVLTDQGMPKLKGEHLAIKLRQIRPDIPIILITGHSKTMTPEKSKASGINALLRKPVEAKELGRIVRRVLDEAKKTKSTGA